VDFVTGLIRKRSENDMKQETAIFSSSIELDTRLWQSDIAGSIAHARLLARQGLLNEDESREIMTGLESLRHEIEADLENGESPFTAEEADIHSALDRLLLERIGAVAEKLNTARSRGDQAAVACRHYISVQAEILNSELHKLQSWIITQAESKVVTARPDLVPHLLAYSRMFERDHTRLTDFQKRALPPIRERGFDAVSDHDFVIEFLSAASLIAMHLSRWCEDLIVWGELEQGFMTRTNRREVVERIRDRTGRTYGALLGALTLMTSRPLADGRAQQEDRFHLFQGLDNTIACVRLMTCALEDAELSRERGPLDRRRGG
jgi:argininosuccinate lyase